MAKSAFFRKLLNVLADEKPAVAATVIEVAGSLSGVTAGNRLLWTETAQHGGLGHKVLDDRVLELVAKILGSRHPKLETLEIDGVRITVFLESVYSEPEVLILGGGHVGQQIAEAAKLVGYRVTAVDDRPSFACKSVFPQADRIICDAFDAALQQIKITAATFITIVTRGHRHDYNCLRSVIDSPASYIGMIGSMRRIQGVKKALLAEGVEETLLERVHAPIGLDIGAETPAEIAVSILAEIIRVFRRGI